LFVDFQGWGRGQLFETCSEIFSGGVYLDLHHLIDDLVCHSEDVIKQMDILQEGVDQRIADDGTAPDSHKGFLAFEGFGFGVDVV
jgi:hypothetical protein